NPLVSFSAHIDNYLAESLRHEGRGDAISQPSCAGIACKNEDFVYRCVTCRDARLFCQACIVTAHMCSPTHIIQYWNRDYFDKIPLKKLGLRYQVGHLVGEACAHPRPAFGSHFTIVDTNGIHDVTLDFCNCLRECPLTSQLQCAWLFPGTVMEPRIAVTVAALEQFQMLTFMGKVSAYEYYQSLGRLSDNTGTKMPPDNFEAFIRIVREWSFIRLLKRAGIGNSPMGWQAAKPASCAVECFTCPRPGINIPSSTEKAVSKFHLLHRPAAWEDTLFIGVDANFKLERFDMSSEEKDPGLGRVLSYFVDTKSFKEHLFNFDKRIIQPQSTCNDHEATKGDKKTLAASGVGGVVCTRHELKLPLSTVDLCVGEMQVEMDYGYLSAVYGPDMTPPLSSKLYLVPKFHLPGHIKECQEKYCMSFHTHVGNNDGEAPEQSWAISNGAAASTHEMSPGHRREKLDQHFGDVNWQKNVSMGTSLLRKIKDAVPNAAEFESHFECFTATLPMSNVAQWTTMVETWEIKYCDANIQLSLTILLGKSEAAMHLQLACEDAQDELASLEGDQLYFTSPKDMIAQGVQIEASQQRMARMNKELGEHSTDLQRAQVLEKSNCLCHRVESWFVQQEVHMPVIRGLRVRDSQGNGPSVPAYSQPLYLPSMVLLHHPCDDVVVRAEARLHIGQGFDLLHTIRGHLLALAKGYKDIDATTLPLMCSVMGSAQRKTKL
ncbi:hypothetical protein EDD18DRAFT_1077920, partial [Armillaria luteobubalina]